METTKIALFQSKPIRKTLHNNEWWFVINDVITALTESADPAQYFRRMKERDEELKKFIEEGVVQFVPPLINLLILLSLFYLEQRRRPRLTFLSC